MLAIIFICIAFVVGYIAGYNIGKTDKESKNG